MKLAGSNRNSEPASFMHSIAVSRIKSNAIRLSDICAPAAHLGRAIGGVCPACCSPTMKRVPFPRFAKGAQGQGWGDITRQYYSTPLGAEGHLALESEELVVSS